MSVADLPDRLRRLIGASSVRNFAHRVGVKEATLRSILSGTKPQIDTLEQIAKGSGTRLAWLAAGDGDPVTQETGSANTAAVPRPDPELFGRVVDRIARVYRDEGVRLADIDLGRIAAERYVEILDLAGDSDEWPALLDLIGTRVRRAIRAAAADPTTVKREA